MQFSAGQLPNALGIMIACHLESCIECNKKTRLYDSVGGELLDLSPPVKVSENALRTILTRIEEPPTEKSSAPSNERLKNMPRPLSRFVPEDFENLPWKGFTRSIQEYLLPISDEKLTAKLYKIAAGTELPEHTHKGNEFTLVMEGSFSDKAGYYHPGDFILSDTETIHQPKATMKQDCICFAVLDAPLKMTGFFGRMLNPFL